LTLGGQSCFCGLPLRASRCAAAAVGATSEDAAAVAATAVSAASVVTSVAADENGLQKISLPPPANTGDQGPQRG
jgi:hypothetical protein